MPRNATITINAVAPGLNSKNGLKRMHYRVYGHLLNDWITLIREQNPPKFTGPVDIVYTRSSVQPMDWDNLAASFKPIGDALTANGVITDDNPNVIVSFTPKWRKAKNNKDLITIIEIREAIG
jgi:hypothetical protein